MKRLILILLFYAICHHLMGQQNLVPNGSFEDTIMCPTTGAGQINYSLFWQSPTNGTPDYKHFCSSMILSYQAPRTGSAYAAIILYDDVFRNEREYIQVQLTDSLATNKKYCVRFYVNLFNYSGFAISNIGLFLSTAQISANNFFPLPNTPQVSNSPNQIIDDTTNWVLIDGIYTAIGGEKYITIGNFYDSTSTITSTTTNYPSSRQAYYYIDDVSVYLCDEDTSSVGIIPNVFTPNGDDKNETFLIPNTGLQTIDCKIYNRWGSIVYNITAPNDFWDGYTTSGEPCSSGVYYYILTATGTDGKEYLRKGYVQLVR